MRVDSPRQQTRLRHSETGYMDMHTTQQAQHTTYQDSEGREEWVDEEMRMEREVEMSDCEEQFIRKVSWCVPSTGVELYARED